MNEKTVLAFGTFDLLHPGHLQYLKRAKELGSKLIVVIARDENVKKIKGFYPSNSELHRLQLIKELKVVDNAVLGRKKEIFKTVLEINPDIIALGYDQRVDEKKLIQFLKENNCRTQIIRLSPFKPEIHKTSKIKEKIKNQKN